MLQPTSLKYVPTQVIVEYLKGSGFGGIVYKSSLTCTNGNNVALFNDKLVRKIGSSELMEISCIQLGIKRYAWDGGKRIKLALEGTHTNK